MLIEPQKFRNSHCEIIGNAEREDSYTFITKISEEENQDVLIHITIAEENPALTVTAGLEGDIQVLLFDIHYERNERSIKC